MISHKMLGLIMAIIGLGLVVCGAILFLVGPPSPSQDAFCGFCMIKYPIYCYRTLHGVLFDVGWFITIAGTVIMLFCRKEKLLQ